MNDPKTTRRKKSDKAKEKYAKTGGLTNKHIRQVEALRDKKP